MAKDRDDTTPAAVGKSHVSAETAKRAADAEMAAREPAPKTAPLVLKKGPDGKPLEQPPVAPVAGVGPLPRTIDQNERAYEGTTRYKIRADALADVTAAPPTKYILARENDEKGAKEHYLRTTGIQARLDALREGGLAEDKLPVPYLVTKKLMD